MTFISAGMLLTIFASCSKYVFGGVLGRYKVLWYESLVNVTVWPAIGVEVAEYLRDVVTAWIASDVSKATVRAKSVPPLTTR